MPYFKATDLDGILFKSDLSTDRCGSKYDWGQYDWYDWGQSKIIGVQIK